MKLNKLFSKSGVMDLSIVILENYRFVAFFFTKESIRLIPSINLSCGGFRPAKSNAVVNKSITVLT